MERNHVQGSEAGALNRAGAQVVCCLLRLPPLSYQLARTHGLRGNSSQTVPVNVAVFTQDTQYSHPSPTRSVIRTVLVHSLFPPPNTHTVVTERKCTPRQSQCPAVQDGSEERNTIECSTDCRERKLPIPPLGGKNERMLGCGRAGNKNKQPLASLPASYGSFFNPSDYQRMGHEQMLRLPKMENNSFKCLYFMLVSLRKGGKNFTPSISPSPPSCVGLQKPV